MTPPNSDLGDDIPVWGLEANGLYSVKSGYALAKGLALDVDEKLWNRIWKWDGIEVEVGWKAAGYPSATLNTDGSVLRTTGAAAAGGAIRNWQGRTIDAFTANLGSCSITRAELTSIVIGMKRSWQMGIRNLEVQTDSRSAVSILSQESPSDHQHAALVL
ncbi:Putative ribonuclease H protein At1g65750 [Linum perenne]